MSSPYRSPPLPSSPSTLFQDDIYLPAQAGLPRGGETAASLPPNISTLLTSAGERASYDIFAGLRRRVIALNEDAGSLAGKKRGINHD